MSNRNIQADHSRARDDKCEGCFYCGLPFGRMHHEHDHAPTPKDAGGKQIVPICTQCHDLKDRLSLANWSASLCAGAVLELVGLGLLGQEAAHPSDFPDDWPIMSREARVLWAKIVRLEHIPTSIDSAWHGATARKLYLSSKP